MHKVSIDVNIAAVKQTARTLLRRLFAHLPVQRGKVVFVGNLGRGYSCNPKYLCQHMAAAPGPWTHLIWVYDSGSGSAPAGLPPGVEAVPYFSWTYLYHIATAGVVVANTRLPRWFGFKKRPGQLYVQTWHSSLRLKCIEADADLPAEYVEMAKNDSSQIDLLISGCKWSSDIFRRAFWYSGEILESGTPRIDCLLSHTDNRREAIAHSLGLDPGKKYVLYAPTFRNSSDGRGYDLDLRRVLYALVSATGQDWRGLARLHPNLRESDAFGALPPDWTDTTRYDDMQHLLCLADLLITDYSSCMFDMAYLGKPCLLYASDLQQYAATDRRLYFDIAALPFPLATTISELEANIRAFDTAAYKEAIDHFMGAIGSFETGAASQHICQRIQQLQNRGK